jgi:hypothetical protein
MGRIEREGGFRSAGFFGDFCIGRPVHDCDGWLMAMVARVVLEGKPSLPEQPLGYRSNGRRRQAEQAVKAVKTIALTRECSQKLAKVLPVHLTRQAGGRGGVFGCRGAGRV